MTAQKTRFGLFQHVRPKRRETSRRHIRPRTPQRETSRRHIHPPTPPSILYPYLVKSAVLLQASCNDDEAINCTHKPTHLRPGASTKGEWSAEAAETRSGTGLPRLVLARGARTYKRSPPSPAPATATSTPRPDNDPSPRRSSSALLCFPTCRVPDV